MTAHFPPTLLLGSVNRCHGGTTCGRAERRCGWTGTSVWMDARLGVGAMRSRCGWKGEPV